MFTTCTGESFVVSLLAAAVGVCGCGFSELYELVGFGALHFCSRKGDDFCVAVGDTMHV